MVESNIYGMGINMTVYYFLIVIIVIISILTMDMKNKVKKNKLIISTSALGIIFLQAFRSWEVGVDLRSYIPSYQLMKNIDVISGERLLNYDYGYLVFTKLLSNFGVSVQLFLAIVSITIMVLLSSTWIKYSKMPSISIFLYITLGFFAFSFSGLRQAIAFALTFYSYRFIVEKNIIKFIFCVMIAITFHFSAIVFILAFPLYHIKIRAKYNLGLVAVFVLVFLLKERIFQWVYFLYRGNEVNSASTGAYTMLIIMIGVYVLANIFGDKYDQNSTYNSYMNYLLVAILIQIFASQSNIIMRLGYYYYLFITLLIPDVISYQKNPIFRILVSSILLVMCLYFFQTTTGSGYLNVSPYQFYWE